MLALPPVDELSYTRIIITITTLSLHSPTHTQLHLLSYNLSITIIIIISPQSNCLVNFRSKTFNNQSKCVLVRSSFTAAATAVIWASCFAAVPQPAAVLESRRMTTRVNAKPTEHHRYCTL
ncbi:hypothetical protein F5B22DRAFT_130149 [Xylaria bambusicola]|uniref:uncharacterized protein n=1 Tax=Xylaria bambusicola TaxID=326684 RepID=UPI0020072210|nr:uncharacterized protein F5B22DRAFT_130149 [Xylaria bambusicola]KAI0517145.1 hypothetical protein F5B22DRAFT_130149 [Xylaria bambusicola]